jgi:hypothetical protein
VLVEIGHYAGQGGFNGERDEDFALGRRHAFHRISRDGVIPEAVEAEPIGPDELRAGIIRKRVGRADLRGPASGKESFAGVPVVGGEGEWEEGEQENWNRSSKTRNRVPDEGQKANIEHPTSKPFQAGNQHRTKGKTGQECKNSTKDLAVGQAIKASTRVYGKGDFDLVSALGFRVWSHFLKNLATASVRVQT